MMKREYNYTFLDSHHIYFVSKPSHKKWFYISHDGLSVVKYISIIAARRNVQLIARSFIIHAICYCSISPTRYFPLPISNGMVWQLGLDRASNNTIHYKNSCLMINIDVLSWRNIRKFIF